MPFQKGKSGNPGGRPRILDDVRAAARQYTMQAIKTLAEIMSDGESEQARATAADKLLDRGWGKAPQVMAGEGGQGPVRHNVELHIVDHRSAVRPNQS